MKKNRLAPFPFKVLLPLLGLMVCTSPLLAETRYYDFNGATPDFGLTSGSTYHWNTSDAFWNTSAAGTGSDFTTWTQGDSAFFQGPSGFNQNSTVNVQVHQSLTLSGLSVASNGQFYFEAAAPTTVTLTPGAILSANGGTPGTGIFLGNYMNVVGDFTAATEGSTRIRIQGTGNAYQGTITVTSKTGRSGFLLHSSRVISEYVDSQTVPTRGHTRFIVNSGILDLGTDGGIMTIKGLSGTGGVTRGTRGTLVVDQEDHTEWGGTLFDSGNPWSNFTKTGSGRLSLTDAGAIHLFGGTSATASYLRVNEGSLYVAGTISKTPAYAGPFTAWDAVYVAAGATLGGTAKVDKRLILSGATSVLNPGMYNEAEGRHDAGVMELQYHVIADQGGTFNFHLGGQIEGEDDLITPLDSRIVVTGDIATPTTLTLAGTKTVNLFDLGLQPLQLHTTYVLFDAAAAGISRTAGWDEDWVLGINATGLSIGQFGVNGNHQITVTFIPEPSTYLLLLSAGIGIWWRRSTARRRAVYSG